MWSYAIIVREKYPSRVLNREMLVLIEKSS